MIFLEWVSAFGSWTVSNALTLAQVLAALVTALATIALWRVTRVLAKETAALAKLTSKAFVVSSFESSNASPTALNMTIRNTGNAAAFDVKLRISPALPNPDGSRSDGENETLFDVSVLPPGVVLPFRGVMGWDLSDDVYEISVSWAQTPNGVDREDLSYRTEPKDGYRGGWDSKGTHHVAQELERIRKLLPGG